MRTVVVFTFVSLLIVLSFDWHWKPKHDGCATVIEEPGGCGNVNSSPGKQPVVFKAKCASCHSLEKEGTGPGLKGKVRTIPGGATFFEQFVKSEDSLIKAKNKYAIQISESRPIDWRHNYKDISSEDWEELVKYAQ